MQRLSARVNMTTVTMPPRTWDQAREQTAPKLNTRPANVNDEPVKLHSAPEPPVEPAPVTGGHIDGCRCGDPHYHLMRSRKRQMQEQLDRLRAHFKATPDAELYSVEVVRMLGCRQSQAGSLLRRLEADGFCVSRHEATAHSGLGRRYYRLREVQG